MKKLVLTAAVFMLVAGCGGRAEKTEAEAPETTPPETTTPVGAGAKAIQDAKTFTASHDCDGTCGLGKMPLTQLTEIDGKYYCPVCVEQARAAAKAGNN